MLSKKLELPEGISGRFYNMRLGNDAYEEYASYICEKSPTLRIAESIPILIQEARGEFDTRYLNELERKARYNESVRYVMRQKPLEVVVGNPENIMRAQIIPRLHYLLNRPNFKIELTDADFIEMIVGEEYATLAQHSVDGKRVGAVLIKTTESQIPWFDSRFSGNTIQLNKENFDTLVRFGVVQV